MQEARYAAEIRQLQAELDELDARAEDAATIASDINSSQAEDSSEAEDYDQAEDSDEAASLALRAPALRSRFSSNRHSGMDPAILLRPSR